MNEWRMRTGSINFAIIGPRSGGKSTLSKFIQQHWDDSHRILSFAAALKDEVAMHTSREPQEALAFRREMDDPNTKEFWRPVLKWWGTELARDRFGQNYWVNKVENVIAESGGPWIVDDCRFPNEEAMLREHEFVFIRTLPRGGYIPDDEHESERYWPLMDVAFELPWTKTPEERFEMFMDNITPYITRRKRRVSA